MDRDGPSFWWFQSYGDRRAGVRVKIVGLFVVSECE